MKTNRWRRGLFTIGLLALPALFVGCIYDADSRCGPNQNFEDGVCLCVEDAVKIGNVCTMCGNNEIPGEGECVCEEGFYRDATGQCGKGIPGLGDDCSSDEDCPESGATVCETDDEGSFCTIDGCESSADCPPDYACEVNAGTCLRPPSGFLTPCESDSDCEGFGANYCEVAQENACMVNCTEDPGVCPGDWGCCDFGVLIGAALCVSSVEFDDEGMCPYGVPKLEAE